jgi:hypothetical protein
MLRHALYQNMIQRPNTFLTRKACCRRARCASPNWLGSSPGPARATLSARPGTASSATISIVTGDRTLGDVLADPQPPPATSPTPLQEAFGDVAAYRDALQALEDLPTAGYIACSAKRSISVRIGLMPG